MLKRKHHLLYCPSVFKKSALQHRNSLYVLVGTLFKDSNKNVDEKFYQQLGALDEALQFQTYLLLEQGALFILN